MTTPTAEEQDGALDPIDRETLQERAYSALRTALLQGQFAPGRAFSIRELANRLGTSATPVREALKRLTAEQALEIRPNRTIVVPTLSAERLREIGDLRIDLESGLGARAAQRVNGEELAHLEGLMDHMVANRRDGEASAYLRSNQDFHFTIYRAADRPVTLRLVEMLWMQCGPSLTKLAGDDAVMGRFEDNHDAILTALRTRDGDGAARAVAADIRTTLNALAP